MVRLSGLETLNLWVYDFVSHTAVGEVMNSIIAHLRKCFVCFTILVIGAFLQGCSSSSEPTSTLVVDNTQSSVGTSTTGNDANGLKILFIGNSLTYSNNLPEMLLRMLVSADVSVAKIESLSVGGFGLPDHWAYNGREKIASDNWDVVVLQQGPSATEGRPYLLEYTAKFDQEIKKVGAKTALYMVWPARARFFDFNGVSDSYHTAAVSVSGLLYPAGEAWRAAWRRDPNLQLYGPDEFHPGIHGTYLAALVMFEQLSGLELSQLPAVIPASSGNIPLSDALAKLLQESAHEANQQYGLTYP